MLLVMLRKFFPRKNVLSVHFETQSYRLGLTGWSFYLDGPGVALVTSVVFDGTFSFGLKTELFRRDGF